MKNRLSFITNDNGFILIHVLFVITIAFILVTGSIAVYRNELYITERQIKQIEIETLFQMGREKYLQEAAAAASPILAATYEFPDGVTEIKIVNITDTTITLDFKIKFYDNDTFFPIQHPIPYNTD